MAEYIERKTAVEWFAAFALMGEDNIPTETAISDLKHAIPAADVAPVVRCKDCEYSYDLIGRRRCSHGICCGRAVPPDFYCAEGKRKEPD